MDNIAPLNPHACTIMKMNNSWKEKQNNFWFVHYMKHCTYAYKYSLSLRRRALHRPHVGLKPPLENHLQLQLISSLIFHLAFATAHSEQVDLQGWCCWENSGIIISYQIVFNYLKKEDYFYVLLSLLSLISSHICFYFLDYDSTTTASNCCGFFLLFVCFLRKFGFPAFCLSCLVIPITIFSPKSFSCSFLFFCYCVSCF